MRGSLCSKRVTVGESGGELRLDGVGGDCARLAAETSSAVTIHETRGRDAIAMIVATAKATVCLQQHTPRVKRSGFWSAVNRHTGVAAIFIRCSRSGGKHAFNTRDA